MKALFQALGILLRDVLDEADDVPEHIIGYFATPLTEFVTDPKRDEALRTFVKDVKESVASVANSKPHFKLYWPGDHTHPLKNAEYSPQQVYITDRARASTFDFILMFCAAPSFGVGQENEIATQGGVAGIRFVPDRITRMMRGSFLKTWDIRYSGSVEHGFKLNQDAQRTFEDALRDIRRLYFRQKAFFNGITDEDFGHRLEELMHDRMIEDQCQFAEEIGISMDYLTALIHEPLSVTNPSATILKRIATLLSVNVSHLLGESADSDPVLAASMAAWNKWAITTNQVDLKSAMQMKIAWKETYLMRCRAEANAVDGNESKRNGRIVPLTETDWDKMYKERSKKKSSNAGPSLY